MELLIRETVGQVLNMRALFRDVNEALQRSITNLRIKKWEYYSLNGLACVAGSIMWVRD